MNSYIDSQQWKESKQRYEALWKRERADRSCLFMPGVLKNPGNPLKNNQADFSKMVTDEKFILEAVQDRGDKMHLAGDTFITAGLYLGTSGHSGYTKKYRYEIGHNTVWFDPVMADSENETIDVDNESEMLGITRRILGHLSTNSCGNFFISNTDNCSSVDALANLRGSDNLLIDMMECPEAVHRHIKTLQEILHRTESEFMPRLTQTNDGGTVTDWMGLWCPGRHHQLQCDLSVMISPDMFREFALPELEENAAVFDHTVYHLDGQEQIRHLDMILSVKGIDLIQWTPVAGQPPTTHFIEVLQRIQKAGKGLVLMPSSHEMPMLLDTLDPAGVCYYIWDISTPEEADAMTEMVLKAGTK